MNKILISSLLIILLIGNSYTASTCDANSSGGNNGNYKREGSTASDCVLTDGT